MMQMAIVTAGTVRTDLLVTEDGVCIPPALLRAAGIRPGDALEIHTDGRLVILVPASASGASPQCPGLRGIV